jgi:uncharacterized protein YihD (DUF1040 family)
MQDTGKKRDFEEFIRHKQMWQIEKSLKMQHHQQQVVSKTKKDCTFKPQINDISNDIVFQSSKYNRADDFLDRVEMYKDLKEEKLKTMND